MRVRPTNVVDAHLVSAKALRTREPVRLPYPDRNGQRRQADMRDHVKADDHTLLVEEPHGVRVELLGDNDVRAVVLVPWAEIRWVERA